MNLVNIGSWKPFLFYFLAIFLPFIAYHLFRLKKSQYELNSIVKELKNTLIKYHVHFSGVITLYHLILTLILALYFIQIIFSDLKIAVDLTYYTKTSITTYQAYDAIQSGEYDYSYYTVKNYQSTRRNRRQLESSYDDLIVVYHTGSWQNVLTSDLLVDICHTEKELLSRLSECVGSDESSMIELIFSSDCEYRTSYEDSLYLFGLEENSPYVENNVDPNDPISHILITYLSVTCSLSLNEVNSAIEKSTVGHIHISYAQTDLIIEAFLNSGLHDIKLSVIAVIVCYIILGVSLRFNFFFATVTIVCILLALVVAVGLLPAFGYDYLSAFNVLAIFVITGVGSDAILIFISSWYKYYDEEISRRLGLTPNSSRLPDLEFILYKSYRATAPALVFTVSTTVLSFMSNLVSPIIVVSQLGAFMGSSMMLYFLFLHLIAIPCWISIVRFKRHITFYIRRRQQAKWGAGIENSSTLLVQQDSTAASNNGEWTTQQENTYFDECMMSCFKGMLWCIGEKNPELFDERREPTTSTRLSNIFVGIESGFLVENKYPADQYSVDTTVASSVSNQLNLPMTHENLQNIPNSQATTRRILSNTKNDENGEVDKEEEIVTLTDSSNPDTAHLSTKKSEFHQSKWLGCGGLGFVMLGLVGFLFLLLALVRTDWGLPLIFPKKDNISGLMYVAVHYKPDILSLSSDGESSNPPYVVPEPTASPTIFPTNFPSSRPTTLPTVLPTFFFQTVEPTHSPTLLPTIMDTNKPSIAPTMSPTIKPTTSSNDDDNNDDGNNSDHSDFTDYSVDVCYGLGIKTHSIDSDATAKFDATSFAAYVETKFLSDTQKFCTYLADNRDKMELITPDSECLYNSLMAVSSDEISIYDRIYLWMVADKARYRYVGAEVPENSTMGNFGKYHTLLLTWVCQPLDCRANISSFFDNPNHAITMIDRWDHALYDKGDPGASSMGVSTLTSSDAWLFPVLSKSLVTALIQSSMISFLGCLCLLLLSTWNFKLVLLVGLCMFFVIVVSLATHALSFSNTINLIDVVVLISFIGIIIDYPTHMAFHYQHDISHLDNESVRSGGGVGIGIGAGEEEEINNRHKNSFNYMRKSLIGPAFTTICSAIPLLFAEFTLISKAGEYVVILTLSTYVFVALIMPTLLRLEKEVVLIPHALFEKVGLNQSKYSNK